MELQELAVSERGVIEAIEVNVVDDKRRLAVGGGGEIRHTGKPQHDSCVGVRLQTTQS